MSPPGKSPADGFPPQAREPTRAQDENDRQPSCRVSRRNAATGSATGDHRLPQRRGRWPPPQRKLMRFPPAGAGRGCMRPVPCNVRLGIDTSFSRPQGFSVNPVQCALLIAPYGPCLPVYATLLGLAYFPVLGGLADRPPTMIPEINSSSVLGTETIDGGGTDGAGSVMRTLSRRTKSGPSYQSASM